MKKITILLGALLTTTILNSQEIKNEKRFMTQGDATLVTSHFNGSQHLFVTQYEWNGDVDAVIECTDRNYDLLWYKLYEGSGIDRIYRVLHSSDGSYYLIGATNSNSGDVISESYGDYDCWVIKLDPFGNEIWQKKYGGTSVDFAANAVLLPNGNILLACDSRSNASGVKSENSRGQYDIWLVCITPDSEIVWDKTIGGDLYDYVSFIYLHSDTEAVIAAHSNSNQSFEKSEPNVGENDLWMLKIDISNGSLIKDKTLGSNESESLASAVSINNNIYVYLTTLDGAASGDRTIDTYEGICNIWALKLDDEFNIQKQRIIGGGGFTLDEVHYTAYSETTGMIICGSSRSLSGNEKTEDPIGGNDYWILGMDEDLNVRWDKTIGTLGDDYAYGFTFVDSNTISIYGIAGESNTYDNDVWIVELEVPEYETPSEITNTFTKNKNLTSYPNPVSDKLFFEVENAQKVKIYSVVGKLLIDKEISDSYVDMSTLESGIYFVAVYTDTDYYVSKIIKE